MLEHAAGHLNMPGARALWRRVGEHCECAKSGLASISRGNARLSSLGQDLAYRELDRSDVWVMVCCPRGAFG